MTTATLQPRQRSRSLDGLRGVAALVVVLGHVLQPVTVFAGPSHAEFHRTGWGWLVTDTPLVALWDGSTAVFVFFVLSGFVLVVGRERDRAQWAAYYPARLLRLYLPVAGSVAIALVLTAGVHQWTPVTVRTVLRDVALVRGVDLLNSPLWSLQWEVIFSLLLPLYVLFARAGATAWPVATAKVTLVLAAITLGFRTSHVSLVCLPIFALGALLAREHDRGTYLRLADRLGTQRARRWTAAVAVVALLAYTSRALLAVSSEPGRQALIVAGVVSIVGATSFVALALYWAPVRTFLERPVVQWLGSRSFSLYLIHWPVLTTVQYLVHDRGAGTVSWVALPLALLAAELFHRGVERPGHLIARRVGGAVQARVGRVQNSVPADPA